jgi:hypothetical protein
LATDVTISPDNQLYVIQSGVWPYPDWDGPISRYTLDHIHAPIPYANTGKNQAVSHVYGRYETLAGMSEKGIAVAPDKRVAYIGMGAWNDYFAVIHADSGCPSESLQVVDTAVHPLNGQCGGIRFDMQGNLYVGSIARSPSHVIPPGFESDWGYANAVGSIARFPRNVKGTVGLNAPFPVTGADKIYTQGAAPFSYEGQCVCRSPRFDVDPYGRLFIPNAITQKVSVIDNSGNTVLEFGEYGNADSRGPGSLVPTADIPLAWPVGAAATDDYIYLTDMINTRLLQVRMDFALNSMPGLGSGLETAVASGEGLRLLAAPNPFAPLGRITLGLPWAGEARLAVYDAAGRLVKTIASERLKPGAHDFTWDATDRSGARVAAGIYVVRATACGKTLMRKIVLTK